MVLRTLTITYDKSNEDLPVMCVINSNMIYTSVLNIFTGERADQLYKELTGENVIAKKDDTSLHIRQNLTSTDKNNKNCCVNMHAEYKDPEKIIVNPDEFVPLEKTWKEDKWKEDNK